MKDFSARGYSHCCLVLTSQHLSDYRVSSETVGPTIASDIKVKASWAILLSLIIMFLYILIRFRNWQFGL
ncbi:MAG: hypothetical protein R2727_07220 [Bacteroidales bacterium]